MVLAGVAIVVPSLGAAACGSNGPAAPSAMSVPSVEAAALREAYRMEGHSREVVFVAIADADDDHVDDVIRRLKAALGVTVRRAHEADRSDPKLPALTPADPQTGQPGIVLRVDVLTASSGGRVQAVVTYARSGLDGGVLAITLERRVSDWAVTAVEHSPA